MAPVVQLQSRHARTLALMRMLLAAVPRNTGIKMNSLCEQLIKALPEGAQPNTRSLTTDSCLRVKARLQPGMPLLLAHRG